MDFRAVIVILIAPLLLGTDSRELFDSDPMLAHYETGKGVSGPWFEGWYTLVEDREQGLSFAVIAATSQAQDAKLKSVPGYAAILVRAPGASSAVSFEEFPQETSILNLGADDFRWASTPHGHVARNGLSIKLQEAEASIEVISRKPWKATEAGAGPEGLLANVPFLPLHWFVHNTNGDARYKISFMQNGKRVHLEGSGRVHQEKNWGASFPESWVWLQAFGDSRDSLALAGGKVRKGPFAKTTYLVGYRSDMFAIDFNIGQGFLTTFKDRINSCDRGFHLEAENGNYKLLIDAKADPDSFAPLSIPTEDGYKKGGAVESLSATVKTRLYKTTDEGWFSSASTLVEERTFKTAALEFGEAAMHCKRVDKNLRGK